MRSCCYCSSGLVPSHTPDGVDVRVSHPKAQVVAELVCLGSGITPLRQGVEPTLLGSCYNLGEECGHLEWGEGAALLLWCPVRGRASHPRSSNGLGQFSRDSDFNMHVSYDPPW